MGQPYVGEIRMFGGSFAPVGWMFCDGQTLPISENETLFQLIGTTYGGDGQETFNLPELASRVPMHMGTAKSGTTYVLAETGGVEDVTLTTLQIPSHTHSVMATQNAGSAAQPQNNLTAQNASVSIYRAQAPVANFNSQAAGPSGGSQPHTNIQPYLAISFIISLFGIFPSQT